MMYEIDQHSLINEFNLNLSALQSRGHMEECLPPQPSPYPWLLYFNDNDEGQNKNQTFCSISDPTRTYSTSIPELMGEAVKVWTVQHGWCLLENLTIIDHHHHRHNLFLWSPSTFKKIELPHLKLSNNITIGYCIFSPSPSATDQVCSIFLFAINTTIIFYCQLGDDQWTEVDCREDLLNDPTLTNGTSFTNPVYCNGSLYATLRGNLVEIQKHELRRLQIKSTGVSLPKVLISFPEYGLHQIIHCFGSNHQLYRILVLLSLDKVIRVVVHKYDFFLRMWEKVESIKDKVFFISVSDPKSDFVGSGSHFVCQAINSETEGGRIYLALNHNDFVYIYNIEDNSLMISQHFSNLPKNRSCLLWFMPEPTYVRSTDVPKKDVISECGAIHLRETKNIATHFDSSTLPLHLVEAIVKCLNVHFGSYTLPLDVVEAIAKCLHVFDYLHLRATSRHLRREAPPLVEIEWRSLFDDISMFPLFVLSYKDNVFTFVHPKHGLKYKYTINFPSQPQVDTYDEIICYSKDGWLLLALRDSSFFFNPFTKQVLPFSRWRNPIMFTRSVGFSHPPTSSECATVECMGIIAYLTSLEGERIPFPYDEGRDMNKFPLYNSSPVFFNGSFYYLSIEGKLGVIQVKRHVGHGEGLTWKELEEPRAPVTKYFNSFLVECDGNLLSIFEVEGQFQNRVHVYKLDEPTMTWIKVESLENHMLFVCNNASFSTVATISGMENKIYFPRLYGQNIVFYSLETNNYHTFENQVLNLHHVREQLNSSWIQPRWH